MVERQQKSGEPIPMTNSLQDRDFQVWLYRVTHGQLLIRSPKDERHARNADIMFVGVEYMDLPRHMKGVTLGVATEEDVLRADNRVGRDIGTDKVTVLISQGRRYLVVAAFCKLAESDMDIFDHPFE